MGINQPFPASPGIRYFTNCSTVLALSLTLILAASAQAHSKDAPDEFFDLSLDEILSVEITSVSKKAQPLSEAAAAAFVITQDDIRRSGVTSIPEALRMAPGIQVARIDSNKWAITSRGFNGRFASKLLVLIDGRSIYTPLFSGVYWDVQDTLLEDIERIEVIRGPGATLWGANAVNGVINIITKAAADTQGGLVSMGAGNEEKGFAQFRYGGEVADIGHYRIYGKFFERDGYVDAYTDEEQGDQWEQYRTGFRTDLLLSDNDELSIQGDIYQGEHGETVYQLSLQPPYRTLVDKEANVQGFNLLGHWDHWVSETDTLSLQSYFERTERDWDRIGEDRNTFDVDLQYRTQRIEDHDLIFGLGYRYTGDSMRNSFILSIDPSEREDQLFSAFVQDAIILSPERWVLTLGSKFEHNDYTGFEIQPNVRLLWTPDSRQSVWASVARAVRTPSRGEQDASIISRILAPGTDENPSPLPLAYEITGNHGYTSEVMIAYEAGYRVQPSDKVSLDLALFYNDYDQLRSAAYEGVECAPSGQLPECLFLPPPPSYLETKIPVLNESHGSAHGLELAVDWRLHSRLQLRAAYTYLQMNINTPPTGFPAYIEGENPMHQASLRTSYSPRGNLDIDLWLRYVDELHSFLASPSLSVDSYLTADLRVAWRPIAGLELSLVGQNLLDDRHPEYLSELNDAPLTNIQRSVYGQIRWEF